jgi:hypothetical protein
MHMRLTWRDVVSTVLVLAGLVMGLSVIEGWGWPLLGGVREGIVAAGIAGVGACVLGSSLERSYVADPFGVVTMVIGMAALAIAIVGGLLMGTQEFLLALILTMGMLWLLATVRHAVEGAVPQAAVEGVGSSVPSKRAFS